MELQHWELRDESLLKANSALDQYDLSLFEEACSMQFAKFLGLDGYSQQ